MRMVEIATNPKCYCFRAGEVLKRYARDKNQATAARYYTSDYSVNLDILLLYGSAIGTHICTWSEHTFRKWIL